MSVLEMERSFSAKTWTTGPKGPSTLYPHANQKLFRDQFLVPRSRLPAIGESPTQGYFGALLQAGEEDTQLF